MKECTWCSCSYLTWSKKKLLLLHLFMEAVVVFVWGYSRRSIMWSSCHSSFNKMLGLSHETFYLLDHSSLFNSILHLVNIILCFFYLGRKFLLNFWCLVWWKRLGLLHGNSHQLDHLSFSEFYLTADIILSTFFMVEKIFYIFQRLE